MKLIGKVTEVGVGSYGDVGGGERVYIQFAADDLPFMCLNIDCNIEQARACGRVICLPVTIEVVAGKLQGEPEVL